MMRSFYAELKRRHVLKIGAIYLVFLVGVLAFANDLEGTFDLPGWTDRTIVILAILGLPIALLLAWMFDLTKHGIIRTADSDEATIGKNFVVPPKPYSEFASIAVLPFGSSSEACDALLAMAIPLELNNTLSRVPRLRIVSSQSSSASSRGGKDLRTIASDLGVDYVISGRVSQLHDSVRVIAELYDAKNDTLLWNEGFDLEVEQAFAAERRIAEAAAMAFGGERLRLEVETASRGQTSNQAAWELVQRARAYLLRYTPASVDAAVSLLQQAVEREPGYAIGHAQLALVTAEKTLNAIGDDPDGDRAAAVTAIGRAESLAPNDPVVLRSAGVVRAYIGQNAESIRLLRRATGLAPYDLGAWGYFGWPLVGTGRSEHRAELLEILERLLAQGAKHPGRPYWLFHKSVALGCAGDTEKALDCMEYGLGEQPRFAIAWMHLANLQGLRGETDQARETVKRSLASNSAFTPEYYASLIARLADTAVVVEQRTAGLGKAGLLTAAST